MAQAGVFLIVNTNWQHQRYRFTDVGFYAEEFAQKGKALQLARFPFHKAMATVMQTEMKSHVVFVCVWRKNQTSLFWLSLY